MTKLINRTDLSNILSALKGRFESLFATKSEVSGGGGTPVADATSRDYFYAAQHRKVNTCKNLLQYYTPTQLRAMITSGHFDDIYVGDYIELEMTTDFSNVTDSDLPSSVKETVRWIVADINYFKNCGTDGHPNNHLVMVAEDCFRTKHRLNTTDTVVNGFKDTEFFGCILPRLDSALTGAVRNVFGADYVRPLVQLVTKSTSDTTPSMAGVGFVGASNNWSWETVKLMLMSEQQVTGETIMSSSYFDSGINHAQFALFKQMPEKIICGRGLNGYNEDRATQWLTNIVDNTHFAVLSHCGNFDLGNPSQRWGIRPYFLLIG